MEYTRCRSWAVGPDEGELDEEQNSCAHRGVSARHDRGHGRHDDERDGCARRIWRTRRRDGRHAFWRRWFWRRSFWRRSFWRCSFCRHYFWRPSFWCRSYWRWPLGRRRLAWRLARSRMGLGLGSRRGPRLGHWQPVCLWRPVRLLRPVQSVRLRLLQPVHLLAPSKFDRTAAPVIGAAVFLAKTAAVVRQRQIDQRPDGHDTGRIDVTVAAVIVALDMLEVHGLGDLRHLIKLA